MRARCCVLLLALFALQGMVHAGVTTANGGFSLSSANSWGQFPQLTQTFNVKETRVYLIHYQISMPASGSHICMKLMVDGTEIDGTRTIEGNINYANNQATWAIELSAGDHTASVYYRTPAGPYMDTNADWEGGQLSVQPLPRGTKVITVNPRGSAYISTGSVPLSGLTSTFSLDKKSTVIAYSTITTQCYGTYLISGMVVDGNGREETRSIVGYTTYCSVYGMYLGNMEAGSHTIAVYTRAGFNANIGSGSDWETYSMQVVILPGNYRASTVESPYSWNTSPQNTYTQYDDNKDAVYVPQQGGVVLFYNHFSLYNPYNSHLVSFLQVDGNGQGLKGISGDKYHGTAGAVFLSELNAGEHRAVSAYRSPVYCYFWPQGSDYTTVSMGSLVIPNDDRQAKTCSSKCDARATCVDGQCVCWAGLEGDGTSCTGAQIINCRDALIRGQKNTAGNTGSGVYTVYPLDNKGPLTVYCDMETDGGGWTVFQRRYDGSVSFMRRWEDYKNGFGSAAGEHWLGNEAVNRMTSLMPAELYVDLLDPAGERRYAKYSQFRLAAESDFYRLTVSGYSGNAGDSLSGHSGYQFTTWDSDHDVYGGNCAQLYHGAWWYTACHASNLNGLWTFGGHSSYAIGTDWVTWHGYYYGTATKMMFRN